MSRPDKKPTPPGVPQMRDAGRGPGGIGPGLGLGLAAASLTAVAGFAADRLNRERRVAQRLDDDLGETRFREVPDEEHEVLADDGVALHVEIDHPRGALDDGGEELGPAPTVVFCHGYCLSLESWVFQRRALRDAGYRVVLWDQRGHGRSQPGERDSYEIDQLGRDLLRVLDAVVPDGPIVLVGHSMGGMTMMSLALEAEEFVHERVVGAAFVATSPGNLAEVSYGLGSIAGRLVHRFGPRTTGLLATRQRLVDGAVRAGRDLMDFLVDWGSFGSPVPMSVAQLTTDMIFGTRMEVISAFMPRFDEYDKRAALARFDGIETLVVNGTADRLTPPEHSEEILRSLPGAEHVLVEGAGHVIMLEVPKVIDEHLLGLLRRARRVGSAADQEGPLRTVTQVGRRRVLRLRPGREGGRTS